MNSGDISVMHNAYFFYCVINIIAAAFAVTGNGMVIAAVLQRSSLRSPSTCLLCCLAVSDFFTGALSQPVYVIYSTALLDSSYDLYCSLTTVSYLAGYFMSGMSFLVLTLINVDRFLALQYPFRYNDLVTNGRVLTAASCCCVVIGILLALPITGQVKTFEGMVTVIIVVCLVIDIATYCCVFRIIHKHEARIETERQLSIRFGQELQALSQNQKKKSRTAAIVSGLYFLCYTPYLGVTIAMAASGKDIMQVDVRIAWNVASTIVYMNAAINPGLYFYRMRNVREAVKDTLKIIFCQ